MTLDDILLLRRRLNLSALDIQKRRKKTKNFLVKFETCKEKTTRVLASIAIARYLEYIYD